MAKDKKNKKQTSSDTPNGAGEEQTIDQEKQTLEIYKNALTFNVIAKYDPKINQLMHLTSYCVVYRFDPEVNDWSKLEYQGPLAVYSRNCVSLGEEEKKRSDEVVRNDRLYQFGLIVLNRLKPENFSIGLFANKHLEDEDNQIIVEKTEKLIILRDLKGDTFGLWIFDEAGRDYVSELLKLCLES